jgi:hypothetical protein
MATSSSEMQLAIVGSGVGRIPGAVCRFPELEYVGGIYRSRNLVPCSGKIGVEYTEFLVEPFPYTCSLYPKL